MCHPLLSLNIKGHNEYLKCVYEMCRRQPLSLTFVSHSKEQSVRRVHRLLMERTVLSRADGCVAGEERESTDWLCLHVCCAFIVKLVFSARLLSFGI